MAGDASNKRGNLYESLNEAEDVRQLSDDEQSQLTVTGRTFNTNSETVHSFNTSPDDSRPLDAVCEVNSVQVAVDDIAVQSSYDVDRRTMDVQSETNSDIAAESAALDNLQLMDAEQWTLQVQPADELVREIDEKTAAAKLHLPVTARLINSYHKVLSSL